MIVILDKMNIDLTVEEFIELYAKTDLFNTADKIIKKLEPVVEKEQEINVVPVVVTDEEGNNHCDLIDKNPDLVGPADLARFLGCGYSTVLWFKNQGMPAIETTKKGKKAYLYDKNICLEWYNNRKNKKTGNKKPVAKYSRSDDYSIWKSDISKICREANKDVGKMLSLTYKYMTKNYGIVWQQEEKEFKDQNGYRPHSTTELAHWMETTKPSCKNLTISCLSEVIKTA